MTDAQDKLLKELVSLAKLSRVSEVARSYDMKILRAAIDGHGGAVTEALEVQRDEAVLSEKRRLGL